MQENTDNAFSFYDLEWDTNFFGVSSAKAVLNKPLSINEWERLKIRFKSYQFISITNENSEPANAQLIGKDTSAFLADVNIQFMKRIDHPCEPQKNITVHCGLSKNDQVIDIADFQFSKFTEDPELAKRKGDKLYQQWLINSFDDPDKLFAISINVNSEINGFLLHSFTEDACVIELIAVSKAVTKGGIGSSLFKAVEYVTQQRGINKIRVGTQVRNIGAVNFYHKIGCEQVACHQVYHLWNT